MVAKLINRAVKSLEFRMQRQVDSLKRVVRVAFPDGVAKKIEFVEQFDPGSDGEYELYQRFFENSLREVVRFRKCKSDEFFAPHTTHVGQYLFHLRGGGIRKVAIDAHDHRNIRSQAIHDWSDVYFKSNRWPSLGYSSKVQPIITGNAGINLENCRFLRMLRSAPKEFDLIFIARIWAGGDANVEHNLRLFESLAKVECKSKLMAVVFSFDKNGDEFRRIINRLEKAGVEWRENQINYKELMRLSAASKLVVLRAGISGCIAWRMVDMLAIGACIVLDCKPFPEWPIPLKEGENFVSLGIGITEDCKPGSLQEYRGVIHKIEEFLKDQNAIDFIQMQNRLYFDRAASHYKTADYILKYVVNITKIVVCNYHKNSTI